MRSFWRSWMGLATVGLGFAAVTFVAMKAFGKAMADAIPPSFSPFLLTPSADGMFTVMPKMTYLVSVPGSEGDVAVVRQVLADEGFTVQESWAPGTVPHDWPTSDLDPSKTRLRAAWSGVQTTLLPLPGTVIFGLDTTKQASA